MGPSSLKHSSAAATACQTQHGAFTNCWLESSTYRARGSRSSLRSSGARRGQSRSGWPRATKDRWCRAPRTITALFTRARQRSEEHTSELQSHVNLVCRLLLEKKKKKDNRQATHKYI